MSDDEAPLDPQFVQAAEEALKEVSRRELGPITRDREIAELGLDSVSLAELIVVLEEKLDISIELTQLEKLRTFGDLHDLVRALMAART